MNTNEFDKKRTDFKSLLIELSGSQSILSTPKKRSDIYIKFEKIYDDVNFKKFRHFYSDIFAVLSLIDKDESKGNIDILNQNMEIIRQNYRPVNKSPDGKLINIENQLNKLYDHINLEVSRINYFKQSETKTDAELKKVSDTLLRVKDNVVDMEKSIDKADEMQKQYITILGIFAAIVIAFTGGITFSSSVLDNITNTSIYRIVLITLILAFVLTNIIYILIQFLREISSTKKDTIFNSKHILILNITYGIIICGLIFFWLFDVTRFVNVFRNKIYK